MGPGTPYDVQAPDGTRYVSFADWLCPVHCIEPATCPMIRAPRTWEMGDAMGDLTPALGQAHPTAGPVLFTCRHRVYGVGMFDVATVLEGDAVVARAGAAGAPVDVLVGTHLGVPRRGEPAAPGLASPSSRASEDLRPVGRGRCWGWR